MLKDKLKNLKWIFLSILLSFFLIIAYRYILFEIYSGELLYTYSIVILYFLFLLLSITLKPKYILYGPICLSLFLLALKFDSGDNLSVDFLVIVLAALTAFGIKTKNNFLSISSIILSLITIYWGHKLVSTPVYNDFNKKNITSINVEDYSLVNKGKRNTVFSKDTVYLLNFTRTFCLPCKEKKPSLEIVARKLKNKPFKLVNVYFSQDERFKIETSPYTVTFYDQKDLFSKKMKIGGAPTEIILDKNGKIRRTMLGYTKELNSNYESDTESLILCLINEKINNKHD